MAEQRQYPQATPDGEAIPFEIIRPLGAGFRTTTSVSQTFAIPATAGFLVLRAKEADCWVMLGADAVVPVGGAHVEGLLYVADGEIVVIDHNGALSLGVIRAGVSDGRLIIQTCLTYADIRKKALQERM